MAKTLFLIVITGLFILNCAAPKVPDTPKPRKSRRIVYQDLTQPAQDVSPDKKLEKVE
jgi:hypothetical protein